MNLDLLRKELEADEGRRHRPYKDSLGKWTIGIGHLLEHTPPPNLYWTDEQINTTFAHDIEEALAGVQREPWWRVLDTDDRQRAVANMLFNLGQTKFKKFHMFLGMLEAKKWKAAGADLRKTLWAKEVPARAERIIKRLIG